MKSTSRWNDSQVATSFPPGAARVALWAQRIEESTETGAISLIFQWTLSQAIHILVYLPIHEWLILMVNVGKYSIDGFYGYIMVYIYVNCELGSKYIGNWKISCVFCCCNAFLEKTGRKKPTHTSGPHTFGWHPSMENTWDVLTSERYATMMTLWPPILSDLEVVDG